MSPNLAPQLHGVIVTAGLRPKNPAALFLKTLWRAYIQLKGARKVIECIAIE
jgi:hypothetical protein